MTNTLIYVDFIAKQVTVQPRSSNTVEGTIEELDYSLILDAVDIDAVIEYFGEGKILDRISRETAIQHFNIEEA